MNDTRSAAQDQIQGDAARTDAAASSDGDVTPARRPRRGRLALLAAGLVALIAAGSWLYGQLTHVVVDDARVAADVIAISSRVPGRVTAVNVVEGAAERTPVVYTVPASALQPGVNTIAVEVHNANKWSGDMGMSMRIVGLS